MRIWRRTAGMWTALPRACSTLRAWQRPLGRTTSPMRWDCWPSVWLSPAGMDNIPVEKIVKLRQEHREEFAAFNAVVTQTVEELRQELSGVTLQEARVRDVRLAVEDRFDRPLQALRKAMKAQGMGTVYGLANVKFDVPALMSLAGTAAGGFLDHPVAGAAAGAALGFMNVRHTHKQQVQGLKSGNPAAYLLSVQRGLKPQSLLRQITQRA